MIFDYFNFHNYTTTEMDAVNFICTYLLCLVVTYYGWKTKIENDINPLIVNLLVVLFIIADVIYESYDMSFSVIAAKMIFTLISCFCLNKILNKIFNG